MRYILLSIFSALLSFNSFSQSFEQTLNKADSLFWSGDYKNSQLAYEEAAQLTNRSKSSYYLCTQKEAESLIRQGFFDLAENKINESIHSCPVNETACQSGLLTVLGLSKIGEGEYEEAEKALDEAIGIASRANDQKSLSDAYNNLSILFWTTGHNEKALSYALNALELRQNNYPKNDPAIAGSYMNLGLLYQHKNPEQAITYYDKAISIYKKRFHENHPLIASAIINKGIVYQSEKTYNTALDQFEQASNIIKASVGDKHINYAFILSHIGRVYLEKNNPKSAEEYEQKALQILLLVYGNKHPEVAQSYNELAAIKLYQHKYTDALNFYQKSLIANSFAFNNIGVYSNPNTNDYIHADLLLNTFLLKAQALEERHVHKNLKLKDLKSALSTLQSADTLSESIRHRRTNKNDKVELGKITNEIYEQAVHLCLMLSENTLRKKSYQNQAFYFSEKNKAAILLEAISEANAKSFADLPDSLLRKEASLKNNVSYLELMLGKAENETDKKRWRAELLNENRTYESFIEKLEHDFPAYYKLKYPHNNLSIKEVQKNLNEETAVLHYFISDKYAEVALFVVDAEKTKVVRKPLAETLDQNLTGFRNVIRYKIEDKYIEIGNALSDQLCLSAIPKKAQLVIIPDGRLSATPFEALFAKRANTKQPLPLLIKKASIAYNYSTSLYLESLKESKTICEKGNVLICAPIEFHGKMSNLPGTEQEAIDLAKAFSDKGFTVTSQLGKAATEEHIKMNTSNSWSYIHFATHGLVNENNPDLSKIILQSNSVDDGDLFSGEIYNLKLNAELITLSACQTGLGKVTKGEGIIGLSRALLYAGANNIIVSLWNVSDAATKLLMLELYKNILANTQCINYASALQKAKLSLLENEEYSQPYYWAPFILVGE